MSVFCTHCGAPVDEAARFCPNCGSAAGSSTPAPAAAITPVAAAPVAPVAPAAPVVRYGGFWIRFLAVVVDSFIISAVVYPVAFIIALGIAGAGYAVRMPEMGVHLVSAVSAFSLGVLGSWLYEALMWSSPRQATVGKILLRLRVTDLEGNRVSFARATGRHFAKYVSAMIFFIGYVMAGFTDRHQALHDMIAGTVVRHD